MSNQYDFEPGADYENEQGQRLKVVKRYHKYGDLVDLENRNTGKIETYPLTYAQSRVQNKYWKFLSGPLPVTH